MHSAALPTAHSGEIASPAENAPQSVESIGRRLREALPPLRLHSISIYDNQCNVLWLSEGALGPDEHALVADAAERLGAGEKAGGFEQRVEDGRVAVFLPVRASRAALTGLVMVLADTKSVRDALLKRVSTAAVHALIHELAPLIRPAAPRRIEHDPTGMLLSLVEDGQSAEAPSEGPRHTAGVDLTPAGVDEILERGGLSLELAPEGAAARAPTPTSAPAPAPAPSRIRPPLQARVPLPQAQSSSKTHSPPPPPQAQAQTPSPSQTQSSSQSISMRQPAASAETVSLEVMPFVKLRSGGRMRRFEVLPRGSTRQNRDPAALDGMAVHTLLSWMAAHRPDWTLEPTSFTLNLSIATLEDEGFLKHLGSSLGRGGISADSLGFEIAEPLCTQRRAQVERFIGGCERLGCFVVIDGFSFDSAVVPLLRSKAVRLVKIDARLSTAALKDKLAQALVVAIVQAVKVLGIHCAAQQIESQQVLRWLTAVGCDFGQGSILARPLSIADLKAPAGA